MRYAIISLMLSMLKICMKCLDLKNKGEKDKRGQGGEIHEQFCRQNYTW